MAVKKKKKFKQRLQHSVRFDIAFDAWNEFRDTSKPLINFVQAGSISDKRFLVGDLILSILDGELTLEGLASAGFDDSFLEKYNSSCLSKGMLDPKDLSGTIKFLISEDSEFINGQNIIIDDGWTL